MVVCCSSFRDKSFVLCFLMPIMPCFVLKFSRSLYFGNDLSESNHTWAIGTL